MCGIPSLFSLATDSAPASEEACFIPVTPPHLVAFRCPSARAHTHTYTHTCALSQEATLRAHTDRRAPRCVSLPCLLNPLVVSATNDPSLDLCAALICTISCDHFAYSHTHARTSRVLRTLYRPLGVGCTNHGDWTWPHYQQPCLSLFPSASWRELVLCHAWSDAGAAWDGGAVDEHYRRRR